MKIHPLVAGTLFLASSVARAERFDRSADLPDLEKAVRVAAKASAEYRTANHDAEVAAKALASGFSHLPRAKRNAAKNDAIMRIEGGVNKMLVKLEEVHGSLVGIQDQLEEGVSKGLGEMRGELDKLLAESAKRVVEKERVSTLLLRASEISNDAVGEKEAGQLNAQFDQVEQLRKIAEKTVERSRRIGSMTESIAQKVETIKAVTAVIEARIAELRCESLFVGALKEGIKVDMVVEELDALGKAGDPTSIFESTSSRYLDEMMGRESRPNGSGMSQRSILKARRKGRGEF